MDINNLKNLIFVDCEATGKCPSIGKLSEFGAVAYPSKATFHGLIVERVPSEENPNIKIPTGVVHDEKEVFENFNKWLKEICGDERPKFVSDNPAFDWQWINDGFHRTIGNNPFGYSARRIGDFYAGLINNFTDASSWKRLRVTKHDHHPVHDAMGNLEAFERMLKGERPK